MGSRVSPTSSVSVRLPLIVEGDTLVGWSDESRGDKLLVFKHFLLKGKIMRTSTSRMSFRGRANNARRRAFQPANYFKLESLKDRTLLAAGVLSSTSISGQKWNDLNGDALHDANEPGLNGWVINVLDAAQNLIATTTTASVDLNGDGSINPVTEQGLYTVEVPPGDWVG